MASEDGPAPAGRDVDGPVLWSILGVAVGAIVMGGLHLLKRALGGFPENPSWVAPISVERSSTFLDETKSGDLPVQSGAAHH